MKRSFKKLAALAAAAAVVTALTPPLSISAAGVKDVFDASYYADSYADLKEAFGYDADALLLHYMTFGLNEGRSASTVFNAAEYRSAYPDLDAAFGDNWNAYVDHYYTVGITEGRTAGVSGASDSAPSDTAAAGQQASAQSSDSGVQTPSSVVNGVYDDGGTLVNVTIRYSDVETWIPVGESYFDADEGCEWQCFTVTVSTDGTPVDPYPLAGSIVIDRSAVEVTYQDFGCYYFNLDYNGVTYEDCVVFLVPLEQSPTQASVRYEAMVPKGYHLTTAVWLSDDTIVKH